MGSRDIVLKIGGSLVYDMQLRLQLGFLTKFSSWIDRARTEYDKIVVVVGGGRLSRHLGQQVSSLTSSKEVLDRIGIEVTQANAQILRGIVGNHEDIKVPSTLGEILESLTVESKQVIISGGFKVGWSSDMDAAVIADFLGTDRVYKISNIDHVYDKDPSAHPDATPIKDISWEKYMNMFGIVEGGNLHSPNQSLPIGGITALFARKKALSYFVSGGKNIDLSQDLGDLLQSGTLIHP